MGAPMVFLSWGWRHRPAAPFGLKSGSARTSLHLPQLSWLHVGAVLMLELCWIQVGPCWVHVGATWSSAGTTSAHVRSKLGLGWPMLGLCWGCNSLSGPMLAHLGAMLAQLRSMLGPGSPILGLCWGYVGPSGVYVGAMFAHLGVPRRWFWGYVAFMTSPSFPKFAWKSSPQWPARHPFHFCNTISLKKLNPAWAGRAPDRRLKAPASGLRGSR